MFVYLNQEIKIKGNNAVKCFQHFFAKTFYVKFVYLVSLALNQKLKIQEINAVKCFQHFCQNLLCNVCLFWQKTFFAMFVYLPHRLCGVCEKNMFQNIFLCDNTDQTVIQTTSKLIIKSKSVLTFELATRAIGFGFS